MSLSEMREKVRAKKMRLDALRPVSAAALRDLDRFYDLEITYTSNAIEGNTLTAVETALVIEKGITIAGKPLKHHLEALDHYDAIHYIRDLAGDASPITESGIRELHRLVMLRSDPAIAGQYATLARFVRTETGRHEFPLPVEVPARMGDLVAWLSGSANSPDAAFTVHRRLVDIHPFNDGNGRTARLLMNFVLLRAGFPPIAIRPEDRLAYIRSLQEAQAGRSPEAFEQLMYERLDAALDDYLGTIEKARGSTSS